MSFKLLLLNTFFHTSRILVALLFAFVFNYCRASPKEDSTVHFLDMKGQILFGKKKLDKAYVRIYSDSASAPTQKIESDAEGWVAFQLPLQKFYTIKITKYGYVTKIVTVDTRVPKSQEKGDYYFEFSAELFEEIEGLDVSFLKEPFAKIFFNSFTKKFDYDYNYTAIRKKNADKLYADYKLLKKQGKVFVAAKEPEKADTASLKQQITETSTASKNESKIVYSVQVLSSAEQVPRNSPRFKGIINVREYKEGEEYKYYVGEYLSHGDAEKMKDRISGYFPDASIAAFKEGKKITLEEAAEQK